MQAIQGTMPIPKAAIPVIREGVSRQFDLEELFVAHKDRVFRAAYRVTGSASDAEDVLQTVFLRLMRHAPAAEISNAGSYLHRSAVNAALDLLRSRKEAQHIDEEDEPNIPHPGSADRDLLSAELRGWLREALAKINPRWAEMFVLRYIEDYDNREIAHMLKTSAAVVAVLLHRTRAYLQKDYLAFTRGRR